MNAVEVVEKVMAAVSAGDMASASSLFAPNCVYHNVNSVPFSIAGRDAYSAFIMSVDSVYNAPRTWVLDGIDAVGDGVAILRGRVTVADRTLDAMLIHLVEDGQIVELFDLAEGRCRAFAGLIRAEALPPDGSHPINLIDP